MARREYKRFWNGNKSIWLLNINFAPIALVNVSEFISAAHFCAKLQGKLYGCYFFSLFLSLRLCNFSFLHSLVYFQFWFEPFTAAPLPASYTWSLCLRFNKNSISVIICCIQTENVLESSDAMRWAEVVVRANGAGEIVPGRRIPFKYLLKSITQSFSLFLVRPVSEKLFRHGGVSFRFCVHTHSQYFASSSPSSSSVNIPKCNILLNELEIIVVLTL